jgi:hypothetical protein
MNLRTKPTAQQAGISPWMVHHNYKKLMTKAEAQAWFAVAPGRAENIISLPRELLTENTPLR